MKSASTPALISRVPLFIGVFVVTANVLASVGNPFANTDFETICSFISFHITVYQ